MTCCARLVRGIWPRRVEEATRHSRPALTQSTRMVVAGTVAKKAAGPRHVTSHMIKPDSQGAMRLGRRQGSLGTSLNPAPPQVGGNPP